MGYEKFRKAFHFLMEQIHDIIAQIFCQESILKTHPKILYEIFKIECIFTRRLFLCRFRHSNELLNFCAIKSSVEYFITFVPEKTLKAQDWCESLFLSQSFHQAWVNHIFILVSLFHHHLLASHLFLLLYIVWDTFRSLFLFFSLGTILLDYGSSSWQLSLIHL